MRNLISNMTRIHKAWLLAALALTLVWPLASSLRGCELRGHLRQNDAAAAETARHAARAIAFNDSLERERVMRRRAERARDSAMAVLDSSRRVAAVRAHDAGKTIRRLAASLPPAERDTITTAAGELAAYGDLASRQVDSLQAALADSRRNEAEADAGRDTAVAALEAVARDAAAAHAHVDELLRENLEQRREKAWWALGGAGGAAVAGGLMIGGTGGMALAATGGGALILFIIHKF